MNASIVNFAVISIFSYPGIISQRMQIFNFIYSQFEKYRRFLAQYQVVLISPHSLHPTVYTHPYPEQVSSPERRIQTDVAHKPK
jgi:hypothetical protein